METQRQDALITLPRGVIDPFYYGFRWVKHYDEETGKERLVQEPLGPQNYLAPQEGDRFPQGESHFDDRTKAKSIFCYLYRDDPTTKILSDVKMVWGIEGLREPAPDLVVIPNVRLSKKSWLPFFKVLEEGTLPTFIIEIVSPIFRKEDREDKVSIYAQADVAEYVWIDPHEQEDGSTSYEVQGYTLQGNEYQAIQPNEQGWFYCATVNVWIGPNEAKDGFVIVDAKTRQPILPDQEARLKAEAEAQALEQKAQKEAQKRKEAEQQAQKEAQKRKEAEAELARLRKLLEQAGLA